MKRSLLTLLLVACLVGCYFVMQQTTLAKEFAGENFTGNADLVAHHLGQTLVVSHYTGIAIVITCIFGMIVLWRGWKGVNRGVWVLAFITFVLGALLIRDSMEMNAVYREIGREVFANAKLVPVNTGNWLWFQREGLEGGVSAFPLYVIFLFGQKALAGAITLGLLLLSNLVLGRKLETRVNGEKD